VSFAHPALLWLLAAAPLLAAARWLALRHSLRLSRRLDPAFPAAGIARRILLPAAAAAALALALAGPRWGLRVTAARVPETDVVFLVDTSGSMLTRDVSPDRFSRIRAFGRSLLRKLPAGTRVGLVRVEGQGEVISPLTLDRAAVENALDELSPRGAATPGSDLGDGLRKAEALLASRQSRGRSIVIFTDGEDLEGDFRKYAAECAASGIVINTVGAGTPSGGPVPARDGGFQRDDKAQPVVSRADESALREVARSSGGEFTDVSRTDASAAPLAASLAAMESVQRGRAHREPIDRTPWALAAAALAWTGCLLTARGGVR
jgi:Ca-activated chloride channel family protein